MKAGEIIRSEWPRIRVVEKKGDLLFEVDARRTGTPGKRVYRAAKKEAIAYAESIGGIEKAEGAEGLTISAELRAFAITAEEILKPFGKTVLDAAQFYVAHLTKEREQADSLTVTALAEAWQAAKDKKSKAGLLDARTVEGIRGAAKILKEQWGDKPATAITRQMLKTYFDSLEASEQTKENRRNLFSQCFNYGLKEELIDHTFKNPATNIAFTIIRTDNVSIFKAVDAERTLRKCEESFPMLTVFTSIGLFAGLRPEEAENLTWENIHLEERRIHVLGSTSKVGRTRNVHIEDTLLAWLNKYAPAEGERTGLICPKEKTLNRRRQELHAALGYRATIGQKNDRKTANPNAETYPQDVLRHSFASHWLPKYHDRAKLAEEMGTSVAVINKHYTHVISQREQVAYWAILPKGVKGQKVSLMEGLKQRQGH